MHTMASAGKVLMLLENNPYEFDVRVKNEARALVRGAYRVSVISPSPPGAKFRETVDGVHLYHFPAAPNGRGLLSYLFEYGYSIAATFAISLYVFLREGFDIIHAHNPPDAFFSIAAIYKLFGKRFVYDHHDLSPEMYRARFRHGGNRFIYEALVSMEKLSCYLADHVIATNESYRAMEIKRGKVPASQITIVRNGPDLERLQSMEPDTALRLRAGTILGYAGIMGTQDGVDYLLRALHHLANDLDRRDFYAVIVGKGNALTHLKALAKQLSIEEYVWFTGWVQDADLVRYLSTADICLSPDPSNPFNDRCTMIKMMEYMALGKPIVAFDLPEHRITAQDAAVYARANDELDFAMKIAVLMDEPELRQKMGRIGRERIDAELAWSYQEKHLLDLYKTLNGDS